MSAPDIEKIIRKEVAELIRIKDRVLPVKVGRAVAESVNENFRRGGFYGRPWKSTRRQGLRFHGVFGRYGPLLSQNNHLSRNTVSIPDRGKVIIRNNTDYAGVHNEGGEIPVTSRMKRFFWAKYYETGAQGVGGNRQRRAAYDAESGFWRGMALKRVGSTIYIPKRQFIGPSPEVDRIVDEITDKELKNHIKQMQDRIRNGIDTRRSR